MVIRMKGNYNLEAIGDFEVFANVIDIINQEILDEVRTEIEPDLLTELKEPVGAVKYPIQWTTPKQKRYYFGVVAKKDAQGNIIPYRRTGKLQDAWTIEVNGNTLVVENKSSIAKHVVGSLAQDRSAALRFQQRFHANTGWQPATDTVKKHLDRASDLYIEKFDDRLAGLASGKVKRRAYTKGTRRR